jgi:DNA-binding SARP family transcriptional activator/TolB-like protein
MSKLNQVTLRLLGTFAIEANVGRAISISVRAKKARALLAYLAMKPDYQARREELATLFWGDNPDMLARHSLRQCLISLRQDLCVASEILNADRETVGLRGEFLAVDARTFMSRAGASELAEAAELWRGAFLPDLVLDIEEFDTWREQEANRLSAAAAGIFEALCRNADADHDGARALAAAEQLVALDPTREDRQRTGLRLLARYKGREAALSQGRLLTDLLRVDLGVGPEPATRALIDAIKKGDFEPVDALDRGPLTAHSVVKPANSPEPMPPSLASPRGETVAVPPAAVIAAAQASHSEASASRPFWRRRPLAAAMAAMSALAIGTIAVLGFANMPTLSSLLAAPKHNQGIVVLPFAADNPAQADDPAFARVLTHDLIGYLSRFANLRVVSEPTSDAYRDRPMGENVMTDLGVRYAIVGHVQGGGNNLRIDFQLVDAATRTNVWSNDIERERGEPTLVADQAARGIARMLAIQIERLDALQLGTKPNSQLTLAELVGRGYTALLRGNTRDNLNVAMRAFNEALRRNPHYQPALLAVARVQIVATMNFIDLDPQPDLDATERYLNEALAKFPNSISALYSLALLQKHRRHFDAAMRLFQRCLEINPSFLSAQAQIGDILTRTGQPQKGLEQVLQTIRAATPSDPGIGYWYLYAAEAELQLGHDQAALDWALRAETFIPGSPLVEAWLAAIYTTVGDKSNAARYVATLRKMAPDQTRLFLQRPPVNADNINGGEGSRLFQGLRLALNAPPI